MLVVCAISNLALHAAKGVHAGRNSCRKCLLSGFIAGIMHAGF
jgi:hypothetical protein